MKATNNNTRFSGTVARWRYFRVLETGSTNDAINTFHDRVERRTNCGRGVQMTAPGSDSSSELEQSGEPTTAEASPNVDQRAAVELGSNVTVDDEVTMGYAHTAGRRPTVLGDDAVVRAGTTIYADVVVGRGFTTGHDVLIRAGTTVGDDVTLGTKSVLDGEVTVGDEVSIQTGVYVPPETELGDRVFLGPNAVLTNDPYPLRADADLDGPTLADDVSVGANATILPGVSVSEGAFVAAGAVVVDDVPPETLAVGAPADHRPLPDELAGGNTVR